MSKPPTRPRRSLAERVRLWLSFQRYSLLLFALGALLLAVPLALDWPWWVVLLAGAGALRAWWPAVRIAATYSRKVRMLDVFVRRFARNGYSPALLAHHVGDPCHNVVVREILARSGFSDAERQTLMAELLAQHEAESNVVVVMPAPRANIPTQSHDARSAAPIAPQPGAHDHVRSHDPDAERSQP